MSVHCGAPDPGSAVLCTGVPAHDGDHRGGGRRWPRAECWKFPCGAAVPCVEARGHTGRHVATALRVSPSTGEPEEVRVEWNDDGPLHWLPDGPPPRKAWVPNIAAGRDQGEQIVCCPGWPECERCTEASPGPVGLPLVEESTPGQQLLAEMVAHTRARGAVS